MFSPSKLKILIESIKRAVTVDHQRRKQDSLKLPHEASFYVPERASLGQMDQDQGLLHVLVDPFPI